MAYGQELVQPEAHRLAVNASWLIRLRWVAMVGQLLTIGVVRMTLGDSIALGPLLAIVAFTGLTNLILVVVTRPLRTRETVTRHTHWQIAGVIVLDLVLLTSLLYYAGGPVNPFSLFYLVNLALAAVILPARISWPLAAIASGCFALLHVRYHPIPELPRLFVAGEDPVWHQIQLHHQGYVVALVTCGAVIVYFFTRISGELQQREQALRAAEQQQARTERLQALATLAAGAGHELATPLSTIAVVAKELERHLEGTDAPQMVVDDIALIRTELARCRTILNRMSTDAGQAAGDQLTEVTVQEIIVESCQGIRNPDRIEVEITDDVRQLSVKVPLQGLAQALRGVIQNAFDASAPHQMVQITAKRQENRLVLTFVDQGEGMTQEVLDRVGEPFFTTKEVGQGTGLGLFLTRSVIDRLGGELQIASQLGEGTTITVLLPVDHPQS